MIYRILYLYILLGTGGDGADTINISTASIILCAACGCKVAKAGNRSVSSQCGSADVLQELGVVIDLTPEQMAECNKRCGVCFMFAPVNHPAMKKVAPVRKALGRSGDNNYIIVIIGHDDSSFE